MTISGPRQKLFVFSSKERLLGIQRMKMVGVVPWLGGGGQALSGPLQMEGVGGNGHETTEDCSAVHRIAHHSSQRQ